MVACCVFMVSMFIGRVDMIPVDMLGFEMACIAIGLAYTGSGEQEHKGYAQDTHDCCYFQLLEDSHGYLLD